MKKELPGILNWAIEGYKEWAEIGLQPPDSVLEAVKAYRADMDIIGSWMQDRCEQGKGHKELIDKLFINYKEWAQDGEEYRFNKRTFAQHLVERGFKRQQTTATAFDDSVEKGRFIIGLRLVHEESPKKYEKKITPKPRKG